MARGEKVIMETGEARVDYIRRRIVEGATKSLIAKELGIPYQVVYAAVKPKKAKAEQAEGEAVVVAE